MMATRTTLYSFFHIYACLFQIHKKIIEICCASPPQWLTIIIPTYPGPPSRSKIKFNRRLILFLKKTPGFSVIIHHYMHHITLIENCILKILIPCSSLFPLNWVIVLLFYRLVLENRDSTPMAITLEVQIMSLFLEEYLMWQKEKLRVYICWNKYISWLIIDCV